MKPYLPNLQLCQNPSFHGEMDGYCDACGCKQSSTLLPRHLPVELYELAAVERFLETVAHLPKHVEARTRALKAIRQIRAISGFETAPSDFQVHEIFTSKAWEKLCENLICNRIADIHFLPPDEEEIEWSAISKPSVVLFRYPITYNARILSMAAQSTPFLWNSVGEQFRGIIPGLSAFQAAYPIKRAMLRLEFLNDLITRFIGLYARLGSSDFTAEAKAKLITRMHE